MPTLLNALYGVAVPTTPRNDLVQVFLTGVPGLNQPPGAVFRSIETIDPTTIAVYPDRLVLSRGDRGEVRVVALQDIGKVRVRTLFGVSTSMVEWKGRT